MEAAALLTWVLYTNRPDTADGMAAREEVALVRDQGEAARLRCLRLARMLEDLHSGSECLRAVRLAQDARRPLYWCEPQEPTPQQRPGVGANP